MTEAVVRRLVEGEAEALRTLRLEALTRDAATFASDAEVEAAKPISWFAERIAEGVLGAFVGGALVGMAGYSRFANPKQRHKATLFGMYLRADQRGSGLAGKLVAGVIGHARGEGVEMLLLAVNANNTAAIRLYELAGFQRYGLEPAALKHTDGTYSDDALYALVLG
ncbi:MAG: GNAT family N-acetyltransferase [Caulobacter sp.]|nr:GNAT family N-acetyltransferase [Caulobacter sp.]